MLLKTLKFVRVFLLCFVFAGDVNSSGPRSIRGFLNGDNRERVEEQASHQGLQEEHQREREDEQQRHQLQLRAVLLRRQFGLCTYGHYLHCIFVQYTGYNVDDYHSRNRKKRRKKERKKNAKFGIASNFINALDVNIVGNVDGPIANKNIDQR